MENIFERTKIHLNLLRKEVEETFGKRIGSSRDCNLLSEEIYSRTSFTINPNTLRRLFGLVKADHPPSSGTVTILANYCGFKSLDELSAVKNRIYSNNGGDHQSDDVLNYIISLFATTPTKGYHNETFFTFVKHTIQFLQLDERMFDRFHRAIAKTKNGQDFYFEQFINLDALSTYYGDGLRYYLAEKKTTEAQIFGHSLLCLRGWLTDNAMEVEEHFQNVMQYQLTKASHPFVSGRFFVTQLLHSSFKGLQTETLLVNTRQMHSALKLETDRFRDFPCFEYVIAPALLMTGHFDEALYYINYALEHYPERRASIEEGLYQTFDLLKALTLIKNGKRIEAENLYQQIRPSTFYFLTKKTNIIMYLILTKYLNRSNAKSDQQLMDLIEQTGFKKLLEILKR